MRALLIQQGFDEQDATVALDFVADLAIDTAAGLRRLDRAAQSSAWAGAAPSMVAAIDSDRGHYDRKLEILLDGLATRFAR